MFPTRTVYIPPQKKSSGFTLDISMLCRNVQCQQLVIGLNGEIHRVQIAIFQMLYLIILLFHKYLLTSCCNAVLLPFSAKSPLLTRSLITMKLASFSYVYFYYSTFIDILNELIAAKPCCAISTLSWSYIFNRPFPIL